MIVVSTVNYPDPDPDPDRPLSVFSDFRGFIVAVCMDREAVTDAAWRFGFLHKV